MRELQPALTVEKNRLSTTSAWLTLLEVSLPDGTVLHLVPNAEAISFDGQSYQPFPCRVESVKTDARGGLADVQIAVANVDRTISAYVEQQDVRGSAVRLLIVNSANLADPSAVAADEEYEIAEITVTDQWVTFRLGHGRLLQQRFPAGRFLRDNCRWIYRSTECGYVDGYLGPGTISSTGVTIDGVTTDFAARFRAGDTVTAQGQTRTVSLVVSDTVMAVSVAPSPPWNNTPYTVGKPTCDKILESTNGCRSHSNHARFGGFPGMPAVSGR